MKTLITHNILHTPKCLTQKPNYKCTIDATGIYVYIIVPICCLQTEGHRSMHETHAHHSEKCVSRHGYIYKYYTHPWT